MSIVSVPSFRRSPFPGNVTSAGPTLASAGTTFDLDGVGQYVACIDYMPRTATVDRVRFTVVSATAGCTALVRIETVDTATGVPTGTLVHANASQSVVIATSGTGAEYEVTFPGTFSITGGTLMAIVIAQSVGTPSAIRFNNFSRDNLHSGMPYAIDYDATAGLRQNLAICMGLGEAGGGAIAMRSLWPINAVSTLSYDQADTPDTIGNKIVIDAPVRASGAWIWLDSDAAGIVKLYDTDGATVLASVSTYTNVPPVLSGAITHYIFDNPVTLTPGTYYLAVEATTGTNLTVYSVTFFSAAWRAGSPMGGDTLTYSTCTQTPTGTGDWTDDTTKQAFMDLIIDGIDAGGVGGGGETAHVFAT